MLNIDGRAWQEHDRVIHDLHRERTRLEAALNRTADRVADGTLNECVFGDRSTHPCLRPRFFGGEGGSSFVAAIQICVALAGAAARIHR